MNQPTIDVKRPDDNYNPRTAEWRGREWLNEMEQGGRAYFMHTVTYNAYTPGCDEAKVRTGVDGNVRISDCSDEIRLEFPAGSKEEFEHSIRKIDLMVHQLATFRKNLVDAVALAAEEHGVPSEWE